MCSMINDQRSMTLNVMEIERFALRDGPGIRTTVFLKGCPLACPWCANPESQTLRPLPMYTAKRCIGCGACEKACEYGFIRMDGARPIFERTRCLGCRRCERACLQEAIRICGRSASVEDILAEIVSDRDYYEASGGGLTVSGGEPFVQAEGMEALLKAAKREGIHTAVETTGQADVAWFDRMIEQVDLYLFDLKHADAKVLKRVTGADLAVIERNLERAVLSGRKIILRVPVIPGFNHSIEAIGSIFALAAAHGVGEADLLPYHVLGINKYRQLGRQYRHPVSVSLPNDELEPYVSLGAARGIVVNIGG